MKPASSLEVEIERLSLGGEGIAHADGMVVFVPYAAPGDRLMVEITERRARYARAVIQRILRPSPERIRPPCPYHFSVDKNAPHTPRRFCGGCSWQHLAYEAQLNAKRELVRETLERIGGLRDFHVRSVLGMQDPWRYRSKVQEPVGRQGDRLVSGFYSPGSHDIVPINDCLVQPQLSVDILNRARALLDEFHLHAYDSVHHRGWIRHLWARTTGGAKAEQALLVFVTRTLDFPHEREIVTKLLQEFPRLAGVYQNVNPARTNVILGRQWRKITGVDFVEEHLGRLRFRLSPPSFFQVNSEQATVLYDAVARLAGEGRRLLDLYCGVGGIALRLADQFEEVGGIEEIPSAIEDARANAELNGIDNARFEAIPVERFLRDVDRRAGGASLTVTLDPPRAGCSPEVVRGLITLRPKSIVYVSCDPGTLARDLALFSKANYGVREIQPVDLFPHTPHIETVVKLGDAHARL